MDNMNDINNINNVVGDELNKILESINLIPDDVRKQIKIDKENKLYVKQFKNLERTAADKTKQAARYRAWRENNKELHNLQICKYMKEKYKNNEEFRKQQLKAQQDKYYLNKYGMTPEEYKAKKEKELKEFIETNKEKIDKVKEKDKLKPITNTTEDETDSDKSNRDKINTAARHKYYMKKYNMSEEEYKKMKHEQYNNKMEKYKDKLNNIFIPSCVEDH